MEWLRVKIEDFCETGSGGTPLRSKSDQYYKGKIPWVKSGELKADFISHTEEYITELALKESSAKIVPSGSILIAMYGATVGQTSILNIDATTNQAVCYIIPDSQLAITKYVWYTLRFKLSEFLFKRLGGAQPNISQKVIKNTIIPLPPISEQRRIVEILDQADELRKKRSQADRISDRILPALFIKMFGDPATNPMRWNIVKTGDVSRIIVPTRDKPKKFNGEVPWVTLPDVNNLIGLFVNDGNYKLSHQDAQEVNNRLMPKHTVLLSCAGTLGRVAIAGKEIYANQQFYGFVCKETIIDPLFLAVHLKILGMDFYQRIAGKSTLAFFSKDKALNINIFLPEIFLQERFARIVLNIEKKLFKQTQVKKCLDNLFQTLLHQAFSGELTAKWREAHMKELLQEMEHQAKALNLSNSETEQLTLNL